MHIYTHIHTQIYTHVAYTYTYPHICTNLSIYNNNKHVVIKIWCYIKLFEYGICLRSICDKPWDEGGPELVGQQSRRGMMVMSSLTFEEGGESLGSGRGGVDVCETLGSVVINSLLRFLEIMSATLLLWFWPVWFNGKLLHESVYELLKLHASAGVNTQNVLN